jgi:hypothetical protein
MEIPGISDEYFPHRRKNIFFYGISVEKSNKASQKIPKFFICYDKFLEEILLKKCQEK